MRNNYSNYLGVVTSAGASDEHPLSIHSASNGTTRRPCGWKVLTTLVLLFTLALGNAWGANGDTLFVQHFDTATTVAYDASGTAVTYDNSTAAKTLSGLTGAGTNHFQYIGWNNKSNCGLAINSNESSNDPGVDCTKKLGAYVNNTSFTWALYHTKNFATTAPTAVKFEMDILLKDGLSSGTGKHEIAVVLGSGFSGSNSAPASNKGYTGFAIKSASSAGNKHEICKVGSTTGLSASASIANNTNTHITWYVNNTGESLTYKTPSGNDSTLATGKYALFIGKKCALAAQACSSTASSAYTGTTIQNLYIGNAVSGRHRVVIDNVSVVDLTPAPACDAPTTAFAEGAYTVGGSALALSSLISNNNSGGAISYTVKTDGGTSASISEGSFSASAAGTATITATQAADATNGKCEKIIDFDVVVSAAPSTPTHGISYTNLKGSDVSAYPTTYYEGTGIASFAALADVADFHFNGWSPSSIPTTAKADPFEVSATWVAAYNVTFSYGAGGGTVPSSFQKWQGAKFNLPGQGSMTAPSGKVFDGWKANGAGDKLAANAEYTMGNAAVEFVAQWKAVPTTIFDWTKGSGAQITVDETNLNGNDMGTLTIGTSVVARKLGSNNIDNNAAGYKLGNNDVCIEIQGTSDFQEGDTVIIRARGGGDGERGCAIASSSVNTAASADTARTNLIDDKNNERTYTVIVTSKQEGAKIRVFRMADKTMYIKSIKVIRPAVRPIASTEISLSDLKVNNRSISSDSLATLVSAKSLLLKDEYAVAPVIKFNEHKVITYSDGESPATKTTDKVYTVTATTVEGKWQASQTINEVAYTVTATKVSSAKVYYYDGSTKLGEETVAIDGSPEHAGDYDDKTLASFVGWYNNSDLAEGHKIANIAELVVTKDTTVYGKWNPVYAQSANLEQWVLDHGKSYGAWAQLGTLGYSGSFTNSLDSLDDNPNKDNRNYAYLGFKVKNESGKQINFRVANGNTVKIKFGNVTTTPLGSINGADYEAITITEGVYTYVADGADAYISIKAADNNTLIFKQIMIGADPAFADVTLPWRVTYNKSTGTCATAEAIWSGAALTLPDVTPADADSTFAGWYDGDDLAGAAGASYNATKNVTLLAHFAPVEYSVTYVGGEGATGSMGPEAKGWGLEYTALANTFEKSGHVFSGWTVTGVDGVSTIPALGSFTMPKNNVTLTAIWTDNSKVAQIVETNVKYESFADAIAAVQADQTIQLLQDCEYSTYWNLTIADTVTLDLNGHDLTYTGTLRGVQVSNGGTLVLMDGTATVAPTIDLTTNPMARTAINYTSGVFDSKDGMCALAGSEIVINSGTYLATEGVILVKGENATATVNDGVLICRDNSVVSGNGTNSADFRNYVMNIHGGILYGEIFSAGYASMVVYHPNVGTLNIDGGILVSTNGPCVVTRGGETNITGGTLVALGSGSGKCGDASLVLPAVGIAVDFKSAYPGVASTDVAVSGTVDVTGQAGAVQAEYKTANPTPAEVDAIGVSGGTFNTELTNEVCAPGFVPSEANAQGKYSVDPKDAVSIIKAVATNKSQDITGDKLTGIYKGAAHIETATDYKLNEGKYFMVQLEEGKNFQAGDIVKINVSAVNDCNGFTLYSSDEFIAANLIIDTHENSDAKAKVSTGINEVELPNTYAGSNKLYVARADGADKYLNAGINQVEVVRVIYPTLTAITFNGAAGTIDEANKTVAITLPEATTDLAALTVVPTIVWNEAAATNSIVVNNGAAWQEGANTYKLTDKDGDATTYTITITLQGNAETPSITAHPQTQAYCADSEPTLSVTASVTEGTLHYAWFKEAGETDEAVGEDQATYTIASAGTYYVIVTNKVDGKIDASTTSNNAVITLNTAAAITAQPTAHNDVVSGTEITLSVTATNATGYQWYICDDADKTNASAISGAEAASYVFTCTASAYYYCVVGNACGDDLTSSVVAVNLEPAGCNTLVSIPTEAPYQYEQTGEWTLYNVDSNGADKSTETVFTDGKNFDDEDVVVANTRRFALKFEKDVESVTLYGVGGSDKSFTHVSVADAMVKNTYTQLTTTATKTDVTDKNHIFTVDNVIIPADKYAWFEFSGSLKFFKICYTEAIEKPVIATQPATKIDFAAGDMTATVVVNDVTEGTLKYQWYNAEGDVEVEGATAATLTTTTEGTYYVIVRNTLAGHKDYAVKSDEATLAYRQANDATLSALSVSAGALDPTFDKAVVEYRVDLPKGTTTVPTLTATATMAAYGATAVVTNAAEFENYEAISTVLVTAEDHTTQKTYTVHFYVAHSITTLVDVTENTTWDWSLVTKKADGTTISGEGPKLNENEDGLILASYLSGDDFDKLEGNHNAYALRSSSNKVYQGKSLHFHSTKGGYLKITAAHEGTAQKLKVENAGRDMQIAQLTGSQVEYTVYVQAGDVRIYNAPDDPEKATKPMRLSKLVFTVDETQDYTRDQMLGAGVYGTICLPYNVPAGGAFGATFYEMAGRNPENGKIVMDEVTALEAGVPYVFEAHGDIINVFYGETHVGNPVNKDNGMYGTFADQTLTELDDVYYFAQRALWGCADLTSLNLPANRAYVKLSEVDYLEPNSAPAPGRRRITFSVNGEQTTTGFEALKTEDAPVKMMIDGKLFILRGEKMYDATGKLVK